MDRYTGSVETTSQLTEDFEASSSSSSDDGFVVDDDVVDGVKVGRAETVALPGKAEKL